MATNAALLHSTLAPVDRLIQRLDKLDADAPGPRLPTLRNGVAARLTASFNEAGAGVEGNV